MPNCRKTELIERPTAPGAGAGQTLGSWSESVALVADLLQRTRPVLNMIGGRQLAILHRNISIAMLKALAGRLRSNNSPAGVPVASPRTMT